MRSVGHCTPKQGLKAQVQWFRCVLQLPHLSLVASPGGLRCVPSEAGACTPCGQSFDRRGRVCCRGRGHSVKRSQVGRMAQAAAPQRALFATWQEATGWHAPVEVGGMACGFDDSYRTPPWSACEAQWSRRPLSAVVCVCRQHTHTPGMPGTATCHSHHQQVLGQVCVWVSCVKSGCTWTIAHEAQRCTQGCASPAGVTARWHLMAWPLQPPAHSSSNSSISISSRDLVLTQELATQESFAHIRVAPQLALHTIPQASFTVQHINMQVVNFGQILVNSPALWSAHSTQLASAVGCQTGGSLGASAVPDLGGVVWWCEPSAGMFDIAWAGVCLGQV